MKQIAPRPSSLIATYVHDLHDKNKKVCKCSKNSKPHSQMPIRTPILFIVFEQWLTYLACKN